MLFINQTKLTLSVEILRIVFLGGLAGVVPTGTKNSSFKIELQGWFTIIGTWGSAV